MVYCVSTFGLFIGLGLGWIPSAFVALIVGGAWPVMVPIVMLYGLSSMG
jgi:hypothetical protein